MIERKADDSAKDDGVLRKKDAAERWSRAVRDDGEYGISRYVLAPRPISSRPQDLGPPH